MDALLILARTFPAAFWIVVALIAFCVIVSLPAILIGKVVSLIAEWALIKRPRAVVEEERTLPYRVGRAYRRLKRLAAFLPFG